MNVGRRSAMERIAPRFCELYECFRMVGLAG